MLMTLCQFQGAITLLENCDSNKILVSRDSENRGSILRIAKTTKILKRPVNKVFTVEISYHGTNQTGKTREQKLRREAAVIGELKRKYE